MIRRPEEMIIAGKYRVGRKLGCGAFGDVHLGTDVTTGQEVAIKLEPTRSGTQQLLHEADLYRRSLKGGRGIAKTLWSGVDGDYNVLVMEVLGPSLQDMFIFCGHRFSLKTVLLVADQVLSRLELVHGQGFVHMDVKPDNFLVGLGDQHETIYIIDFGLTKRYKDVNTGRHLPCRTDQILTGTARYASLNTHLGIERSRRDDLESFGYVLLYFLRGDLPWQGLKANTKQEKYERIMYGKKNVSVEDLCRGLPTEFQWYLQYCRDLKFEETPNYYQMKRAFKELLYREGLGVDQAFDWTLKRQRLSMVRRGRPQKPHQQHQQRYDGDASGIGEHLGRQTRNDDGAEVASATDSDVEMKPAQNLGIDERDGSLEGRSAAEPPVADRAISPRAGRPSSPSSPTPEHDSTPNGAPPLAALTRVPSARLPSTEMAIPPRSEHPGLRAKEKVSRAREPPDARRRGHENGHGRADEAWEGKRPVGFTGGGPKGTLVGGAIINGSVRTRAGVGAGAPSSVRLALSRSVVERPARREPVTNSPVIFPPFLSGHPPSGFPLIGKDGSSPLSSGFSSSQNSREAGHLISPTKRPSSGMGDGYTGSGSGGETGSGSGSGSSIERRGSSNASAIGRGIRDGSGGDISGNGGGSSDSVGGSSGNGGDSSGNGSGSTGTGTGDGTDGGSLVTIHPRPIQSNPYRVGEVVGTIHAHATESNEEAIKAAIVAFQPPSGRRRVPVPAPRCGRSLLYMYGVITEDDVPEPDPKKMQFHCLASPQCRHASITGTGGPIPIQKKATGNGTRHLKTAHNIESVKTRNERDRRGHLYGTEVPAEEQKTVTRKYVSSEGSLDAAQRQKMVLPTDSSGTVAPLFKQHEVIGQRAKGPLPFMVTPLQAPRSPPLPQFQFQAQGPPPPSGPPLVGPPRHLPPSSPPRSLPLLSLPTLPSPPEGPYNHPRSIPGYPVFRNNGSPAAAAAATAAAAAAARNMALSFVKLFVISHLRGFDVADDPAVREFLTACSMPGFPWDRLSADDVKHYISELYEGTKASLVVDMHGDTRKGVIHPLVNPSEIRRGKGGTASDSQLQAGSSFHASFELWNTCYGGGIGRGGGVETERKRARREKYICLRVHWLTQAFALRTASLAVRRWPRPMPDSLDVEDRTERFRGLDMLCRGEGGSIDNWMRDVLEEHGVEIGCLFSTVTDLDGGAGGGGRGAVSWEGNRDVSSSCRIFARMSRLGISWEWSIAHVLDTVLAEAFCISPLRSVETGPGNTAARGIIDRFQALVNDLANDTTACGCKTTFRYVRLASHGAYADRSNAFPLCWVTTVRVMEHTLAIWTDLEEHYTHHRRSMTSEAEEGAATVKATARFPLADHRAVIEELYSILKPVAAVIERTQDSPPPPTTGPTCITSLVDLATLRLTVADPSRPLLVYLPHKTASDEAGGVEGTRKETHSFGEPGAYNITKVTRPVTQLNAVTKSTRELLKVALDLHFFSPRYDENHQRREDQGFSDVDGGSNGGASEGDEKIIAGVGAPTPVSPSPIPSPTPVALVGEVDYVFEMASCMDPFLSQLFLIDSLASSPEHATRVKSIIWGKVVTLAVSLAEADEVSAGSERHAKRRGGGYWGGRGSNLQPLPPLKPQQSSTRGGSQGAGGIGNEGQSAPASRHHGHSTLDSCRGSGSGSSSGSDGVRGGDGGGGPKKRPRMVAFGSRNGVHNGGRGGGSSIADYARASPESLSGEEGASDGRNFDVSYILDSGVFGSAPKNPRTRATTHKEWAEAELEAFKALGAKRTFGAPPLKDLLSYWASEGTREFPYLARAARVLLAFPTSSLVCESEELSGAEDRLYGRRGGLSTKPSGSAVVIAADASDAADAATRGGGRGAGQSVPRVSDQGYAEMVLLLHNNRGTIPRRIPVLGKTEAWAKTPRRWLELPAEDKRR